MQFLRSPFHMDPLMPNPIEVEQLYRDVLNALLFPSSVIQRLRLFSSFFTSVQPAAAQFESYLIDLFPRLATVLRQLPECGLPPAELESLLGLAIDVSKHSPALEALEGRNESIYLLRTSVVRLYAFVGEMGRCHALLQSDAVSRDSGTPDPLVPDETHPRDRLVEAIHESSPGESRYSAALRAILRQWDALLTPGPDTAFIPVVDHPPDAPSQSGSLRQVRLIFTEESHTGKDEAHTDVFLFGGEESPTQTNDVPLAAARNMIRRTHPHLADRFCVGYLIFDRKTAIHAGRSAGLAIAVLWYDAILHTTGQRDRVQIRPGVALTGDVDEEGLVRPIESQGLRAMVSAAFFSPLTTLAVPEDQLADAEAVERELSGRYPRRTLTILGVRSVEQVVSDLRLVDRQFVVLPLHAAKVVWRARYKYMSAAAILFVTFFLVRGVIGSVDRTPAGVTFAGRSMVIMSAHDDVLGEFDVGEGTVRNAARKPKDPSRKDWEFYAIDGRQCVVFIRRPETGSETVEAWSIDPRHRLWTTDLRGEFSFPQRPDASISQYSIYGLDVGDLDGDGHPEVVFVGSSRDSFPGVVSAVDAADGAVRTTYINAGHLGSLALADLDGDGIEEIVVGGTNDAFQAACVAVLDYGRLPGSSPAAGEYVCASPGQGGERAYLLIPRTEVGELLLSPSEGNDAVSLRIDATTLKVAVEVDEGSLADSTGGRTRATHLVYRFDRKMRPVSVGQGDSYRDAAERLFREGVLQAKPDDRYFSRHLKEITYWSENRWIGSDSLLDQ
jgi:hypothetical protein